MQEKNTQKHAPVQQAICTGQLEKQTTKTCTTRLITAPVSASEVLGSETLKPNAKILHNRKQISLTKHFQFFVLL